MLKEVALGNYDSVFNLFISCSYFMCSAIKLTKLYRGVEV